jgi:hypothetical protein
VDSTIVAGVGYDDETLTLEVHFTTGAVYQYFDVPRSAYDEFLHAASKGQYFNEVVKNGYRYMRL